MLRGPLGLTANDLKRRKDKINASEVPAVVGSSPFLNKGDIYEFKNTPLSPLPPSEAMKWGQWLERPLLYYTQDRLRKFLGIPTLRVTRQGIRRSHPNGCMACTLDARLQGRDEAIEAKTHAVLHGRVDWDAWGNEEWTDAIPQHVLDQVLAQQAVYPEMVRTWVVLWAGRSTPSMYCVERANHLARIAHIERECCDFWNNHILPGIPPAEIPHMETVKRDMRVRLPDHTVTLSNEPVELSKRLGAQIAALEKQKREADAAIRRDMSGAMHGITALGHRVTISEHNRKGYTVAPTTVSRMAIELNLAA